MSKKFFRIEMLPAYQGDALWIEYGTTDNTRRILIDGGPVKTYAAIESKLNNMPDGDKGLELIVITHIDTDHIEGLIRLFAEKRNKWTFNPTDIWFNGWRHIKETQILGGREGDFLSALIERRTPDEWNKAFDKKAVLVEPEKPIKTIKLKDGMKLSLLSPNAQKLNELAAKWETDVKKYELSPGDLEKAWEQLVDMKKYKVVEGVLGGTDDLTEKVTSQLRTDQSAANGTSIAFHAKFGRKSCLFLADAHPDLICESIRKLIPNGKKRLKVDAVKVSHHGSKHNITDEIMKLIDAKHYLISTNGSFHKHPDKSAIETIINGYDGVPEFWFNYKTEYTSPWAQASSDGEKKCITHYPKTDDGGIVIEL